MAEPAVKRAKVEGAANGDASPASSIKPSVDHGANITWWRERLGEAAHMQLPTDYARGGDDEAKFVEEHIVYDLPDELCRKVAMFVLTHGNSKPFDVVLGAFAVLLFKYTRETAVVVGSSSPSCNPLMLHLPVENDESLHDIIFKASSSQVEAFEHEVPYDDLLKALRRLGEEHKTSLMQVRVLNNVDVDVQRLEMAQCDWTLFVEQVADTRRILPLRLRLHFNAALFKSARMHFVLRQLASVIEQAVTTEPMLVRAASLVTQDMHDILPDPTVTLDDKWEGAIPDILTRRASAHPNRVFIEQAGEKFTYRQVEELSNRLANYLVERGIQPEDRVALYAHRSASLVVGIMGILKSGATFTVIDPQYPSERQKVYLEVAQPRAVVCLAAAPKMKSDVQDYIDANLQLCCQLNGLSLEDYVTNKDSSGNEPLMAMSADPCGVQIGPDHIGTLSFTSGSTGKPKGVRGRHVSLTHFYPWMGTEFGLSENDRFSMLSGIAHDPIQRDVFTPIFFGASIHIPSHDDIFTPGQLSKWMAEAQVTVTHLTPAMGQLLVVDAAPSSIQSLRVALFVGDILTRRDIQSLIRAAPRVTAVNMYGTTETQRAVSYVKIPFDAQPGPEVKI